MRSLAGAALVLAGWLMQIPEAFWLGMFLIVTATFKFCPNYAIFNFNTLGDEETKTTIPWEVFLDLLPNRGKTQSALDQTNADNLDATTWTSRVQSSTDSKSIGLDSSESKQTNGLDEPDLSFKKTTKFIPNIDYYLPPELTQALIKDIEKNALDEMLVVRFYENFFGCKISIEPVAHLNIYVCQFPHKTSRLEFARLKAGLLDRLHESGH